MAGLDPAISDAADARVKPAHDDQGNMAIAVAYVASNTDSAALAAPMEAAIKAQAKAMPLAMMIRINNSDRMTFTLQLPAVQLNF